jgi:hypothetical protein
MRFFVNNNFSLKPTPFQSHCSLIIYQICRLYSEEFKAKFRIKTFGCIAPVETSKSRLKIYIYFLAISITLLNIYKPAVPNLEVAMDTVHIASIRRNFQRSL